MKTKTAATGFAVLAAALYAINVPLSKLLLGQVAPTMMAAFLYLGAGLGLLLYGAAGAALGKRVIQEPLTKKELPYVIAMVVLDIAAPILLMLGIARTTSASVSLLNNFEIVATSLIALFVFREVISRRLFAAILLVVAASVMLGFEGKGGVSFQVGSLFVFGACICWGMENNCTRMISSKSSVEIVIIKGCCSGLGSFVIAFVCGEELPALKWVLCVLLLGFVAYGLSIHFYIMAQKDLGAAKTSAYYSVAPFLGVLFSMVLLGERPALRFYVAALIMVIATILMVKDTVSLQHTHAHEHIHTHEHSHGGMVHTHEHSHVHDHLHTHNGNESVHDHKHNDLNDHNHIHTADI